ncbi:MAG: hypothetical protein ACRD1P_11830, partial [Thermoanaerobaculia bacterium]
ERADRADCSSIARAERAETAFAEVRLVTRISVMFLPVTDLIFALWASVNLILTSFAMMTLLLDRTYRKIGATMRSLAGAR